MKFAPFRTGCRLALLTLCLAVSGSLSAAEGQEAVSVGVSPIPPLVISESDRLSGFDIELWEAIAAELSLEYDYQVKPFSELLAALKKGEVDVAIAGITITGERERSVDFTHHYMNSGLAVLVAKDSTAGLFKAVKSLFKRTTLLLLLGFLGFSVLCAHILWLSERGSQAIDDKYYPGIFEAFWCALATATTVGYGDVVPRKFVGRLAALVVMLAGIGFFGILSAELMSTLTTVKLGTDIEDSKDLKGKKVATVEGTTSGDSIRKTQADISFVSDISQGYRLLQAGVVDAVVYDAPVLRHYVYNEGAGTAFLAGPVFERQYYGIAVRSGSPLRERINRVLLELRTNGTYDRLYQKWFGELPE